MACLGFGSIILILVLLFFFFPYQRALKMSFQDFLGGNKMTVSFVGVRSGIAKALASHIIVGHENIDGQPLFELDKATLAWNPFSLFKGTITMICGAKAYGGTLRFSITDIPVVGIGNPRLSMIFGDINLAKYPEGRLPWFKSVKGILNGSVYKDLMLLTGERRKGVFSVLVKNGVLYHVAVKTPQELTIPFKNLTIEGRTQGDNIIIDKLSINGQDISIRGSGLIESGAAMEAVNLKLSYEAISKAAPLPGKGVITVSGNIWQPDIVVAPESLPPKVGVATTIQR
ncbi:MAG: hypothetical protein A4E62_00921 [Syntrophorhabdus sp. PtaU1.Bin002]|nr:MAG: hypothetical protein A4E58_00097 [Syntrophorhabdus sp. PtaB.Bin006]OPY72316.1 MAG: hypothetical protein A4E62_00921 [Syntrophorhabdus sp. PtaU1.Bin002]